MSKPVRFRYHNLHIRWTEQAENGRLLRRDKGCIHLGDEVYAWNEATGESELKPVVETYINETTELVHVFVKGEEIISTPSHPFYSPVKGWTNAIELRAGDILQTVNGELVVVEYVQHELLESPVKVYNFQVADDHTYYVSDTEVLVHNTCIEQTNPGAIGQKHHPISRKIERAARDNPNLKDVVKRNKWGTVTAKTKLDHMGYQKWHRDMDQTIIAWLRDNKLAKPEAFISKMNELYGTSEMIKKFGTVIFK